MLKYQRVVSILFKGELKPIEGMRYALNTLTGKMAVVSSPPLERVILALKKCRLEE